MSDTSDTKLSELSEVQLSELLDITFEEALAWLEKARFISDMASLGSPANPLGFELESHELLMTSSVQDLMYMTVGEVQALKSTGGLYNKFPYLKNQSPQNDVQRLHMLKKQLRREKDFEARYPAAYRLLFGELPLQKYNLPSFGVSIAESAPETFLLPANSVDRAFSSTELASVDFKPTLDISYQELRSGFLQGLLIAILSREEYSERIATEIHFEGVRERIGAPARAEIRLTDLRLASHSALENVDATHKMLREELSSLKRLDSGNQVKAWKREILQLKLKELKDSEENLVVREELTVRITFAAAALLLFHDSKNLPEGSIINPGQVASLILDLAKVIERSSKSLGEVSERLGKVLARKSSGRPRKPGQVKYNALVSYRLGKPLREIAVNLQIRPYRSSPSSDASEEFGGTRQWLQRIHARFREGASVEDESRPLARSVFKGIDKQKIRTKAGRAHDALLNYDNYHDDMPSKPEIAMWYEVGNAIHVDASTIHGLHVIEAYTQLGSCIANSRSPYPNLPEIKRQSKFPKLA